MPTIAAAQIPEKMMGLLDDLQSEVEKIKADEQAQDSELESQAAFYQLHLKPAMRRAHEYFSEVVSSLNIVKPEVKPVYPLNPLVAKGVTLVQGEYEFDFDSGKNPRQLHIRCSCCLRHSQEFEVATKDAVLACSALLDRYDFAYHRKDYRDDRLDIRAAHFTLVGPMKVHISLQAHAPDRCIYVHLRNLEEQPVKRYKFSPGELDDTLLDRLARLLVREKTALVEVSTVSDETRRELREQVERDRRRNDEEIALAYADIEAEKAERESAKLSNRSIKAIGSGADRAKSAVNRLLNKVRSRLS